VTKPLKPSPIGGESQVNPSVLQEEYPERMGWTRTAILSLGALAGVLGVAGVIHVAKRGKPEAGPKGWGRTALLGIGSAVGVVGTAGIIHVARREEMKRLGGKPRIVFPVREP